MSCFGLYTNLTVHLNIQSNVHRPEKSIYQCKISGRRHRGKGQVENSSNVKLSSTISGEKTFSVNCRKSMCQGNLSLVLHYFSTYDLFSTMYNV